MARYVVARVGEIPPGGTRRITVRGREIGVFHVNGEYFALLNRCPHQGAPLCQGRLYNLVEAAQPGEFRVTRRSEMLRCPWHGWEFDIRTGQSWCDPERVFVKSYGTAVQSGEDLAKGPYVAETFAVHLEEDYILVEA